MENYKIGLIKRILEFLIFILSISLLDLTFNLIVYSSLNTYITLELSLIFIISIPIFIFKHNFIANIYSSILLLSFSTLVIVNLELYYASSDIFTFKYLSLLNEASEVMNSDFINIMYILLIISYVLVYYIFLLLINIKIKNSNYKCKKPIYSSIVFITLCVIIRMINYNAIETKYKNDTLYQDCSGSDIVIRSSSLVKRSCVHNYGLLNYIVADISCEVFNYDTYSNYNNIISYSKESSITGVCKNYNVIEIMIETGTSSVINKYLTPNIYNLMNNGITLTCNYSKNKTNVSEYIGIAGSVSNNIKSYNSIVPQSLPNVLNKFNYTSSYFHCNYPYYYSRGILMPNLGFDNSYFNYYDDTSYDDSVHLLTELDWKWNYDGKYPYDYDYYNLVKDYMIPSDTSTPFYSYWTTLSTHGPYNYNNSLNTYYLEFYNILKNYELDSLWTNNCLKYGSTVAKQFYEYQCKMMVFDRALGLLIDDLKEKGLYDNTLIVLYGDHDPYYKVGIDKDLKYYIYDTEINYTKDSHLEYYSPQYETFMCFSNPNLVNSIKENINSLDGFIVNDFNQVEYQYFTSPYIIVPTILDILGIKYNMNNYVGTSIFQDFKYNHYDNIFYSLELGLLFTNNCMYDSEDIKWTSEEITDLDVLKISALNMLNKINSFNAIYNNDYYSSDIVCKDILDTFTYF